MDDDWKRAALADSSFVAEFLLRLKRGTVLEPKSSVPPPPRFSAWGSKRPRTNLTAASRPVNRNGNSGAVVVASRKKGDAAVSTRCSPTTPLSWSGSGSPSSTAAAAAADGGFEESSRHTGQSNHAATRSKGAVKAAIVEYVDNSTSTKNCKRKKTYAELVEEENSLLQEREYLREEIANRKAAFDARRTRNESLKKLKLDLDSRPRDKPNSSTDEHPSALPDQQQHGKIPSVALTSAVEDDTRPQTADSKAIRTEIPDLNMMPSEDDSFTDGPSGTS
ncbi:hypothetical protein RIF29_27226 [Crotalaria pallida]|uniref:Uncharacterized protein n=1 Tax=Crotalaria pallida TaxID=3830 RepID=A0AAN9ETL0_CROPI